MNINLPICLFFLLCLPLVANGQVKTARDSVHQHKNVIRMSLTQPLLFGSKNLVIGYERVLNKHQSISMNIGLTSLPKIISIDVDSLSVTKNSNTRGYNVALDYRFYLRKENKFQAPRGVYIGPYLYVYTFDRTNNWSFEKNGVARDFTTEMKMNIAGGGLQLGYQFIFWRRLALDLVLIGPGIARYNFDAKIDGELNVDEESDVAQALKAWLDEKYPGVNLVWGDKEVNAKGHVGTTSIGYRYLIHVGFNF